MSCWSYLLLAPVNIRDTPEVLHDRKKSKEFLKSKMVSLIICMLMIVRFRRLERRWRDLSRSPQD